MLYVYINISNKGSGVDQLTRSLQGDAPTCTFAGAKPKVFV